MNLTDLEKTLIGGLITVVLAVVGYLAGVKGKVDLKRFKAELKQKVNKSDCESNHKMEALVVKNFSETLERIETKLDRIQEKQESEDSKLHGRITELDGRVNLMQGAMKKNGVLFQGPKKKGE